MKTLDEVREELWVSGLKYAKACIDLGLSKDAAIAKYIADTQADKDTLIIVKCSIALAYV